MTREQHTWWTGFITGAFWGFVMGLLVALVVVAFS